MKVLLKVIILYLKKYINYNYISDMSLKKNLNFLLKQKWTLLIIVVILILLVLMIMSKSSKTVVTELFKKCDIIIGGSRPQDIIVKDDKCYSMILIDGDLGLGESYMYGYWTSNDLLLTLETLLANWKEAYSYKNLSLTDISSFINHKILNYQTKSKISRDASKAYDTGNELYERMLDDNMQYTCAFFQDTNDLNVAQKQKMDLIAQKLNLKPGEKVLDIGCGFGSLGNYLSNKYGVYVDGVSLSQEQVNWAKEKYKDNKKLNIMYKDYRDIPDDIIYDKIVSVGCVEHIGLKNYDYFTSFVYNHLKQGSLALLHFYGTQTEFSGSSLFIDKYIFPGTHVPHWNEISPILQSKFYIHDWHNFGKYYKNTLIAWYNNINKKWSEIPQYNDEFKRMWNFYLLGCAANFGNCNLSLWQILLSKGCPDKLPRRDSLIKY